MAITAGVERDLAPGEAGHGIEFYEVEIVFTFAAGFGEDFIKGKFLVEESGAGVEGIGAEGEAGVAAPDAVGFFQEGDLVAPMGEEHPR